MLAYCDEKSKKQTNKKKTRKFYQTVRRCANFGIPKMTAAHHSLHVCARMKQVIPSNKLGIIFILFENLIS